MMSSRIAVPAILGALLLMLGRFTEAGDAQSTLAQPGERAPGSRSLLQFGGVRHGCNGAINAAVTLANGDLPPGANSRPAAVS